MNSIEIENGITNADVTYSYDGRNVTFVVTAKEGYIFDAAVTGNCIETGDMFEDETEISFVKTSDKIYTGNVTLTYDDATARISGTTKEDTTPSKSITNKVNNTSIESSYTDGKYQITLTTESGYVFEDDIICVWTDNVSGITDNIVLTINDDKTIGYCELETSEYSDIVLNGETIPYTPQTKLTNNIANTTLSSSIVGTSISGYLKATDDRFVFIDCFAKYEETTISLTPKTETDNYIKFVFEAPKGSDIILSGECRGVCKTNNKTTGCTTTGLQSFYIEGDTIEITLLADADTEFLANVPPTYEFNSPSTIDSETGNFVVSDDKKTATLSFTLSVDADVVTFSTFTISGYTIPSKTITGYGSVNVYKVTDDQLESFADVRFKYVDGKDKTLTPDGDLGDYIVRLHKVFVDVTDTTTTTIKCGNNDTGIESASINYPTITLDCGECDIPSPNGNVTDYISTINVFVPFVGFVKIDSDNSGKTLRLVYEIDVVNGYGVYTLYADDIPIAKANVCLKRDVLYRTSNMNQTFNVGSLGSDSTSLMGLTPYVIYKYFNEVKLPYHKTREEKSVSDCSGYIEMDITDINISQEITKNEVDMIISQFRTGVII